MSDLLEEDSVNWDERLHQHVMRSQKPASIQSLLEHITTMDVASAKDQVVLLSSISNYHWAAYLTVSGDKISRNTRPKLIQHVLFHPGMQNKGGKLKCPKTLPVSPRNQLMYFHQNAEPKEDSEYLLRLVQTVQLLLKHDMEKEDIAVAPPTVPSSTNDSDEVEPPKRKKKRYTSRLISAAPQDLFQEGNLAFGECLEGLASAAPQRTHYTLFSEELVTSGTIQWRRHSEEEDTVVMNDYCSSTGKLKPLDYVHVKSSNADPDELLISCSCRIYQYMQGKALRKMHLESGEDAVLDSSFTCMHCRFFKEYLHPIRFSFGDQDNTSQIHQLIQKTLDQLNNPVALLGSASSSGTTKFSVAGQFKLSLVHLYFNPQGLFVRCMDGRCQTLHQHIRKKLPKGISMEQLSKLKGGMCDHLSTLISSFEILEQLFPKHFAPREQASDELDGDSDTDSMFNLPAETLSNDDDFELRDYEPGSISFNVHEGKWESTSHSQWKQGLDRFDPHLVKSTCTRLSFITGEVNAEGAYIGPTLRKTPPAECPCGAGFFGEDEDGEPVISKREVKVYTRQV